MVMVPNSIAILRFDLDVMLARSIAVIGLFGAVGIIFWLNWSMKQLTNLGESRRIDALFGTMIVRVKTNNTPQQQTTEVHSIEDLVLLAEHYQEAVLSVQNGVKRDFFVHAPQITYHYRLNVSEHMDSEQKRPPGKGRRR